VLRTRGARTPFADLATPFDFNRDGRVNVMDEVLARGNLGASLGAPAAAPTIAPVGTPSSRPRDRRAPPRLDLLT